ncbi:CesT family type III secretion system chaperone [Hydrogenophaga sp. BPS33]|uniref:CesT family type III secretion system chaperone n=1 Tax=Hydrogenophaga sp. BPS33 TaxID=2651974 RepID=UPI00131F921F|nr:CesT family type III secretion system chaperone [Hydrogenophaga sp. BPS33]QHE87587.1 hypothetical protein F9K07_23160 [Hydrogenophaga sp. BPS33]
MPEYSSHELFFRLMSDLGHELGRDDIATVEPSRFDPTVIEFEVESVAFLLVHAPDDRPDRLTLICRFGTLPGHERVTILERLLQVNFLLAGSEIHLAMDPMNEEVVLISGHPLIGVTAHSLTNAMTMLSQLAQRWRQDFMLDTTQLSTPVAAGLAQHV